jgi:D-tyrosyl-tRNA(Tyr) deacylase
MRALIQRVSEASVHVDGRCVGAIDRGLLVLLGIERGDDRARAERMVSRLLAYRVFADAEGKMNLGISDIQGGVLLVSQFTLAADTSKGLRPGFSTAALPDEAEPLYQFMADELQARNPRFASGIFGATMQVHLINDGPVTFLLQT